MAGKSTPIGAKVEIYDKETQVKLFNFRKVGGGNVETIYTQYLLSPKSPKPGMMYAFSFKP